MISIWVSLCIWEADASTDANEGEGSIDFAGLRIGVCGRAGGDGPQTDRCAVGDAFGEARVHGERDTNHRVGVLPTVVVTIGQVGSHDELPGDKWSGDGCPQWCLRSRNIDGGFHGENDFTDVICRDGLPWCDAGRHRVDAGSSPKEPAQDTEGEHGRDDQDDADDESTVHLAGDARRDRH